MKRRLWFFILGFLFFRVARLDAQDAQAFAQDQLIEVQSERLEQSGDEQGMFVAELDYYRKHPLSINKASREELATLGLLTPLQIEQLLIYRSEMGFLIDEHELQAIPGWDLVVIRSVLPFITVVDSWSAIRRFAKRNGTTFSHRILFRLGNDQLFSREPKNNTYAGDLNRALFRYQYQSGGLAFGCTAAKDPGEAWRSAKPLGLFDFRSFHFQIQPGGPVRKVVAGDFTVQLGQGLIQWQRLSFGKSGEVTAIKRQGASLQPYRSSGTFYFYRGAGVALAHQQHQWTIFYSGRKLDAHFWEDSSGMRPPVVTSILRSGYHRTTIENQQRDNQRLRTLGGQWKYRMGKGHIALNAVHHQFRYTLEPGEEPYQKYYVRGNALANYSIDHSFTFRNMHWFSEWATCQFRSYAWCTGILASLHYRLDAAILVRNWAPSYQAFFANGFGESSAVTNERGVFTSLVFRPSHSMRIEWMADVYRNPWLRYRQPQPALGQEQMIKLVYAFSRNANMYFMMRKKRDEDFATVPGSPFDKLSSAIMTQFRVHVEGRLEKGWELRLRMESVKRRNEVQTSHGFLGYVDLGKSSSRSGVILLLRFQYYATDDYSSRIYAYEPDVMYAGRTRFFYGSGIRWCVNFAFPVLREKAGLRSRKIQFWMRVSRVNSLYYFPNTLIINNYYQNSPLEIQGQLQLQF